jgi:ATP-binding cassette subfamily B multidrug efflux pump
VIFVSQRVATIADADRILVLEDGLIVGDGTHHALLASCPTYVEIVDSQLSAQEAA